MVITDWIGLWTGRGYYRRLGATLARVVPATMVFTLILGFVSLLFLQIVYGGMVYATTDLLKTAWLIVLVMLGLGFYALHTYQQCREDLSRPRYVPLVVGGMSTGLFLGVAIVFVSANVLMLFPEKWNSVQPIGLSGALDLPTVIPRFLHIVLASVAGLGILLMLYGMTLSSRWGNRLHRGSIPDQDYALWVMRYGVAWTLGGTLPQIVVGPWLLLALPEHVRGALVSGETVGSLAFFVSLTCALLGLVLLNAALMVPKSKGLALGGLISLMVTIVLMVVVRDQVRFYWLRPHFDQSVIQPDLPIVMINLSIGILLATLGLIIYTIRKVFKPHSLDVKQVM